MDDRVRYLCLDADDSDVPLLFATKEVLLRVTAMVALNGNGIAVVAFSVGELA